MLQQSKEEKRHLFQKHPSACHKSYRKFTKSSSPSQSHEQHKIKAPLPLLKSGWCCFSQQPPVFITSPVSSSSSSKLTHLIAVSGSSIGLPSQFKSQVKSHSFSILAQPKQLHPSQSYLKQSESPGRKLCILTAIKPSNVEREKMKFFKSDFAYNPQFEYSNPALSNVLAKHSQASGTFLKQVNILLTVHTSAAPVIFVATICSSL